MPILIHERWRRPALILNLGVPRSGTVLIHSILRHLHETHARAFVSHNVLDQNLDAFVAGFDFAETGIVHAHAVAPSMKGALARAEVVGFFNHRDPRDVLASLMRLHEIDFDHALGMTVRAFGQLDAALDLPGLMLVPYALLTAHKPTWIHVIAHALGLELTPQEIKRVDDATAVGQAKKKMKEVRAAKEADPDLRVIPNKKPLRESRSTLINERHIQSGRAGRWKTELNAAQRVTATTALSGWIQRLGYEEAR